ncbi:578_t:CDS:2, partial [Rhizophagus irregularis]
AYFATPTLTTLSINTIKTSLSTYNTPPSKYGKRKKGSPKEVFTIT